MLFVVWFISVVIIKGYFSKAVVVKVIAAFYNKGYCYCYNKGYFSKAVLVKVITCYNKMIISPNLL